MTWLSLQTIAQLVIGDLVNSLPEGSLIAVFAWVVLRFLPRQNSGTRFAVWFVALLAVAGLPIAGLHPISNAAAGYVSPTGAGREPLITLPGPWGLLVFLAWVVAASAAMLRLVAGLWRLRQLRKQCIAIDPAGFGPLIRKTVADFSSSRLVTVATSDSVEVAAAIGFFRPTIVIPTWLLRELPEEQLNIVLLHEFAHLQRRDDWTNLLQKVVRALFVFHPAVWWIERRLSLEREMACDDQVLAQTANPRGYAKCLIVLLERTVARHNWAMAQAVIHRAREASLRLVQILDTERPSSSRVWKPALGLVGVFSLICILIVPRAPELVAFRLAPKIPGGDVHGAGLSRPEIARTMIPAALRPEPSSSRMKTPQYPARRTQRAIQHQERRAPTSPQVVTTRWSADTQLAPIEFKAPEPNQRDMPEQTLLVVRTTQRVGQNSWKWSVSVWRIIWVNPAPYVADRGSATKKT